MTRTVTALALVLAACEGGTTAASADAESTGTRQPSAAPFDVTPVADFTAPWAMTFLPDGRMLVTEKDGRMLLVPANGGTGLEIGGIPQVDSAGQGGLMDVVLHPQFASNGLVYFSYSEARGGGKNVVLARGKLTEGGETTFLANVETLFRAEPVEGNGHYSGRIAFAPDGNLFFTAGERQKFTPAQDKRSALGKIHRLTADGKPAPGNPLAGQGFQSSVWSYGHRNLLGIAFDAQGRLWEQEMGPKGGDEVNLIEPGKNYGYPIVSNGDHYDGRDIPDHSTRPEFEAPEVSWNPVISPAGLMFYSGDAFPDWKGDLFIGGLSSQSLVRVEVSGDTAREAARYAMGARIREVEQGPGGGIYLLEDADDGSQGRMLRLTPMH